VTTIVDAPPTVVARATPAAVPRVTQWRVITSEWIKLRSLRSTVIAFISAIVVLIGLGLLFSGISSGQIGTGGGPFHDPTGASLAGVNGTQLIVGVLGVLFIAGEYSTGMIRSSLAAVPKRLPVLWGKAVVFASATFALMTAASFAAFLGGQAIFAHSAVGASLGQPGVLRAVFGAGVFLSAVGLIGIALGALLRNTAGAIATLFGVVFLLPSLIDLILPQSWSNVIGPYLPGNAGDALMRVHPTDGLLSPWPAAAVLLGYLIALFAGAAIRLKRRDA
jgi:ABC-type transport system involved in multi-copper enzyme maturation permease subunit